MFIGIVLGKCCVRATKFLHNGKNLCCKLTHHPSWISICELHKWTIERSLDLKNGLKTLSLYLAFLPIVSEASLLFTLVASWRSVNLAVFFFIVRMEISLFLWKIFFIVHTGVEGGWLYWQKPSGVRLLLRDNKQDFLSCTQKTEGVWNMHQKT